MTHPPATPLPSLADAHNHLHDPRLAGRLPQIIAAMRGAGIRHCTVNGTCEADWPDVARLAELHPDLVSPAFGLHPWHAADCSPGWLGELTSYLDRFPRASIGECGLDRTRRCQAPPDAQRNVFAAQLRLAATRSLPITIHCVRAWGPLLESLRATPPTNPGFLLHSYSGASELIGQLATLGAHFSFSARSLDHPRLAALLHAIPAERILVETDAPDLPPPDALTLHPLAAPDGAPLNHPANLPAIAEALAAAAGLTPAELRGLTSRNFLRLFGNLRSADP